VHHLGENYATYKVGTVGTPIGSYKFGVSHPTHYDSPKLVPSQQRYRKLVRHSNKRRPFHSGLESTSAATVAKRRDAISGELLTQHSPPNFTKIQRAQSVNNITATAHEQSFSSSSSLSKRSSSNLNTIAEQSTISNLQQQQFNPKLNRTQSKTVPIPMKSSLLVNQQQQLQLQHRQVQAKGDLMNESSTDEYSSSIASTPDTMYSS